MANHSCILGYGTLEKQGFRVFKKRMVYYASFDNGYFNHRTKEYKRPLHWFELAKEKMDSCVQNHWYALQSYAVPRGKV